MRFTLGVLAVFLIGATLFVAVPARAQVQNPIQAAKDAYHKAKQQSQQLKQQGQTQNQQFAPTQTAGNDCCSADAMKKYAAAASFLDIVGISLGMTPKQASAALKAYNATYKTWVVNTRLDRPSNPQGFVRVPRYIFAQSPNMNASNGQIEHITIQFTSPPNPPVVQEVERYVQFHVGEPVLASNLMDSLRKKYGQENSGNPGDPTWVYDANGKLLTQVPNPAVNCQPTGNVDSFIVQGDATHDAQDGGLNLSNTVDQLGVGLTSGCVPYIYAKAWGIGVTPNDKVVQMRVSIRSGALTYNSIKATHNWLQAEADAIKNKNDRDAARRAGPKL